MEQTITFSVSLYALIGGALIGGISIGILLAVVFHKRENIKDLINNKL